MGALLLKRVTAMNAEITAFPMSRSPMNEEKRRVVNKAMAIIGPTNDDGRVRFRVSLALGFVRRSKTALASGRYGAYSKQHRDGARRAAYALHRLQHALRDPTLPRPPDFKDEQINDLRDFYEAEAAREPLPPAVRATNHAKYEAANWAARILRRIDPTHPLSLTRNGSYNRLAAVLYGDETANLLHVCRIVRNSLAGN